MTAPRQPSPHVSVDTAATTAPGTPAAVLPLSPDTAGHRYALGDEIARGGMGAIYRATDTTLGREVAIKVLQDKYSPDSSVAHRFADEARITAQLQHPAIPPVHDLGTLPDGRPFLAMKLIKGQTLDELLAARPDSSAERGRFVAVFEQVCQAVAYAHAHGVIHRDLKPANVMVGAFGEVQVMDWGLAKVLGARPAETADPEETRAGTQVVSLRDSDGAFTQAGSVLGTPAFMPPEQAVGAVGKVDQRSDVFGLGAILAVILTGKPPFAAASAETIRVKAAQGDVAECFTRVDGCGAEPELVELCKRCLNPKAAERPADGREVAASVAGLRQAAEERARAAELERVRAEGERLAAELRSVEERKRRRVQRALAVAVGLLLMGGLAFGWWQAEQGRVARERQARNAEAVAGLLDQCEKALRASDAAAAALTLEAAQKRAAEGGAEGHAERLVRYQDDLTVLRDLDAIDLFRWTVVGSKFPESAEVASRYRATLGCFGADPDAVGAETAAERVSVSAVRERLVSALDWLLSVQRSRAVQSALRSIDPDPFRDAFRGAVRSNDRAAAVKLADREVALEQPPGFAIFSGNIDAIQPERRREILMSAVHRRPGDLGLLMFLAHTYWFKQGEESLRWYQAAVAVAPANANMRTGLGWALSRKGNLDEAIAAYKEALRIDPMFAGAHNGLGIALEEKKDLDGAIAAYRESIRIDPNIESAVSNLGAALQAKGDPEGPITAWKEAVRFHPQSVWPRRGLGIALRAKGDLDGAIAAHKEAIRLDPNLAFIHNDLGIALRDKGDLDGAIAECKEAIRIDPKYAYAHDSLGWNLQVKRDLDGAIAAYKEAIRIDPRFAWPHKNLGLALEAKGDLEGAITAYREAIRIDPNLDVAIRNLGEALRVKGDPEGPITAWKEVVRLHPKNAEAQLNFGWALAVHCDLDGAIAACKEVVRIDPKYARAHYMLGLVLYHNKDLDGSIAAYKEALRVDANFALAQNNLGLALEAKGDLDGATAAYKEALRIDSKFVPAYLNRARMLQAEGDLDGAIAAYEEIIRIDSKNNFVFKNLRQTQRMRELLPRLPDLLAGKYKPKSPAESCSFAHLCCQRFENRYADGLRLFEDAFADDPKLAETDRYDAACYAVLAGSGKKTETAKQEDKDKSQLRAKALTWLRADLVLRRRQANSGDAAQRQDAAAQLMKWLFDLDLACVRPGPYRMSMPAEERAAWDKLWADVKATLALAQKTPTAKAGK